MPQTGKSSRRSLPPRFSLLSLGRGAGQLPHIPPEERPAPEHPLSNGAAATALFERFILFTWSRCFAGFNKGIRVLDLPPLQTSPGRCDSRCLGSSEEPAPCCLHNEVKDPRRFPLPQLASLEPLAAASEARGFGSFTDKTQSVCVRFLHTGVTDSGAPGSRVQPRGSERPRCSSRGSR